MNTRDPLAPRRSCTIYTLLYRGIPLANVRPISLLLCLVEVAVEIDYELLDKSLAQETGLKLGPLPSSLELKVLLLLDVSANCC
jgi:hypothetical protein